MYAIVKNKNNYYVSICGHLQKCLYKGQCPEFSTNNNI